MLKDIISINDFTREDIISFLQEVFRMSEIPPEKKAKILKQKRVACLFFEPSTRTRLSFETAAQNLGARVIGFSQSQSSSVAKGESLIDTIKTVQCYADFIVIRHPLMGSARLAAEVADIPVINAGDGANQHPTQTLLDLYTIQKAFGRLDNLCIGFIGDLKYSRTVHSLVSALRYFKINLTFISPSALRLPKHIISQISGQETDDLQSVLSKLDLLYVTRIQKERFADPIEYKKVQSSYSISIKDLVGVKSNFKIMHPLPRVDELSYDVDETQYAIYFDQVINGVVVRETVLALSGGQNAT